MISTAVTTITPNVTSELYNITVTCTIHPDSTADECVVMAMDDDDGESRTGSHAHMYIMHTYVRMYIYTYVKNDDCM